MPHGGERDAVSFIGRVALRRAAPSHELPERRNPRLLRQLKTLQSPPAFWHFGDTDPSGFHILADLRERSGVPFRSYQMNFRQSARAARLKDRERVLIQELVAKMPGEGAALETMLAAGNKGDFEQEA